MFISFSSTFSIISEQQHIGFIIRNLLLGLGICYLSTLPKNWFDFPVRPSFALTYIGVNLVFVLVERGAFLLSGSVILCETQSTGCLLPVAAWQAIWTRNRLLLTRPFRIPDIHISIKTLAKIGGSGVGFVFLYFGLPTKPNWIDVLFDCHCNFLFNKDKKQGLGFCVAIALLVIVADIAFTSVRQHTFDLANDQ